MIYQIESWSVQPPVDGLMHAKSFEFAKKLVEHFRRKWPECDHKFLRNISGDRWQVCFVSKHKSLADAEQFEKLWPQESGAKAIMAEWVAAVKALGSRDMVRPMRTYMADVE